MLLPGGRLVLPHASLKGLMVGAYAVQSNMIFGGPKWLDSDRFDIEAKSDPPPPDKDLLLMIQSLLAYRFQLRLHNETKVASGYALVIARNGPKIQPASA